MFIYSVWDEICLELSKKHNTIRVDEILEQKNGPNWLAIKHDVETNVSKALELAKIESKYNIKATYFVQADLIDKNHEMLKDIALLGHEVTYHYDVLDANGGCMQKAINDFNSNIEKFNKYGFEVKTVCPHGNPVMIRDGWNSNKDFFRDETVKKRFSHILDMVVELPKKLNYSYTYISDAGYSFKEIVNIEDNDIKNSGDMEIKDTKELLKLISVRNCTILSTHPHRWEGNSIKFIKKIYIFKVLRYIARVVSRVPVLKNIISKYYYLAKKI